MCGICGIYMFEREAVVAEPVLKNMVSVIKHRGPDGDGIHIDRFVGLGHTRLSIIDLDNGKQPMANEDGTLWVTYNGEIYNFSELRNDLSSHGHIFRTNCDTEVIIHAYEEYGKECVSKFDGMFAFALWDSKQEQLFLARDRMGVKPLYYTCGKDAFVFASEVKGILAHPSVKREIEPDSISQYLFCTVMLDNATMFKNVQSLPAGHTLLLKRGNIHIEQYWDIPVSDEGLQFDIYRNRILELLEASIQLRMISDVPLGSLLSGGLDSSLITALAAGNTKDKLHTFSLEFEKNHQCNKANSDLRYAGIMSEALGTFHRDFLFHPDAYNDVLDDVVWHLEKPVELTTPSVYLLYKELKEHVTVVLTGEGADELFGGYFFFMKDISPEPFTECPWAPYFDQVSALMSPELQSHSRIQEKISTTLSDMTARTKTSDHVNRVLYLFLKLYLIEMLERQDKTSMAWGVEARVPFMDYRLVELAASIPSAYKLRNGIEKYILKEAARKVLPSEIVDRRKKPFPFPVDIKSMMVQIKEANHLVQSNESRISQYFDKKATDNFFNRRGVFEKTDSLAVFRTSFSLLSLESWHKVFKV